MICPRCHATQEDGLEECRACGVVFARWRPRPEAAMPATDAHPVDLPAQGWRRDLAEALFRPEPAENPVAEIFRGALLALLALLTVRILVAPMTGPELVASFLHWIDLPFHEAGHFVFQFFGTFLHILGGTLGQLLVPLIVAGALLRQRDPFGAAAGVWWMGQSFVDCAPYIADARARQLLLISGETGQTDWDGHDWYQLLSRTGLLGWDLTLARMAWVLGALLMVAAVGYGAWLLWKRWPARA